LLRGDPGLLGAALGVAVAEDGVDGELGGGGGAPPGGAGARASVSIPAALASWAIPAPLG